MVELCRPTCRGTERFPNDCRSGEKRARRTQRAGGASEPAGADNLPYVHTERNVRVQRYGTNIACKPSGPFAGPMVVSSRPFKPADAIRAVQITSRFPAVHGAPVHLGHPHSIGIKDIAKPDYGDPVPVEADEIPVFWACGVTPQAVIAAAKLPFAITHAPGLMLVTDLKNKQLTYIYTA